MLCSNLNYIIKNHFSIIKAFLLIFILSVFCICNVSGQNLSGAKQSALCNSTVAQSNDAFGIFDNPAGTAQLGWREFSIYYSPSPYGLKELATANAVYSEHTGIGNFGIGFSTFGFRLFRENKFAISYAERFFGDYFLGITFVYQNLKIENYGSANAFNIILGGISYLTRNLRAGFAIENLLRSTYGNSKDQIPVVLKTGLTFDVLDYASLNLALLKELGYNLSVRFGAEFLPVKFIALRFGAGNYPQVYSAGVGINYSIFQMDYAVENHSELGLTHQFGLTLQFSGFENRTVAIKQYLFDSQ